MTHQALNAHALFQGCDPELFSDFWAFHSRNLHLFEKFKANATLIRNAGHKQYGAWCIMQQIRWQHDLVSVGSAFKINNDFTALYARMLAATDPTFKDFFQFRGLKPIRGRRIV